MLVGLEIGKETQLLEQFEREILSFVDDQQDVFPLLNLVEEYIVDLFDESAAAAAGAFFAKFRQNRLEQLSLCDSWIEDQSAFVFFVVDFVDEMTAKCGLSASYFSGQHDESLLFRDPVLQVLESFLVSWAEVKEVRIGGYVERHLSETVETLIHKRKLFFKPG